MTGCPANLPLTHAPGQQHDTPFQAVVVEAHHCHQPQAFYAQLRQQGLTAIHFIPQLAAGDAALWGEFLCAVFHRWVREDIGRINILLFSETLSAWCGETLTQPGEQEDPLCAGYRQFYDLSGPYMRVMRDLRRQQRPPEALMPLLR
ncbi:regulator [Klebsiella variicola]|nr:regulator [Klebsiella variicola]